MAARGRPFRGGAMKRILIVDDDNELCSEVVELLAGEGHSADTAHDGARAVELAASGRYDVIFLDYKLPGFNPLETLERLRESQPEARILIISGRPFLERLMEDRRLASLADGTLDKPFSPEVLLEKIKDLR